MSAIYIGGGRPPQALPSLIVWCGWLERQSQRWRRQWRAASTLRLFSCCTSLSAKSALVEGVGLLEELRVGSADSFQDGK
jgi:hypothetical protein